MICCTLIVKLYFPQLKIKILEFVIQDAKFELYTESSLESKKLSNLKVNLKFIVMILKYLLVYLLISKSFYHTFVHISSLLLKTHYVC